MFEILFIKKKCQQYMFEILYKKYVSEMDEYI